MFKRCFLNTICIETMPSKLHSITKLVVMFICGNLNSKHKVTNLNRQDRTCRKTFRNSFRAGYAVATHFAGHFAKLFTGRFAVMSQKISQDLLQNQNIRLQNEMRNKM